MKNNLWVLSDECYEQFVYDIDYISLAAIHSYNKILTFQSCSKTYAMTGWRIGYTLGHSEVVSAMAKLQGQSTSCPNSIAQFAAIEALSGDQASVKKMSNTFKKRRDLILKILQNIENVHCEVPNGAFYIFPDFSYYLGSLTENNKKIKTASDLCLYILDSTGVVTVSGDSFGSSGHIRFSYAASENVIIEAMGLVKKSLLKLNF
jgi:aspartate aminotransferase